MLQSVLDFYSNADKHNGLNCHLAFAVSHRPYARVSDVTGQNKADVGLGASIFAHASMYSHLVEELISGQILLQWGRSPLCMQQPPFITHP